MTTIPAIRTAPANYRAVPALLLAVTLLVGCTGQVTAYNQPPNRWKSVV